MTSKLKQVSKGPVKKSLLGWVQQHKVVSVAVICLISVTAAGAAYWYNQQSQKFSKADFDKLTAMAETVLKNSGGKDIQTSRTCSYERPTEISSLNLYCRIAMVTYMPYTTDEAAISSAQLLEKEIGKIGKPLAPLDQFFANPSDNAWTVPVNLGVPYHDVQCRFEIATQRFAKTLGIGLQDRDSDNLIALTFYCSAESQAEYFPVTYRQG